MLTLSEFNAASPDFAEFEKLPDKIYGPDRTRRPTNAPPPDGATLFLVRRGGTAVARAAAMKCRTIRRNDRPAGWFGWFEAENDAEAVSFLFDRIFAFFRTEHREVRSVIGPMNGSTWQAYRVSMPGGDTFFLDNHNPDYYAGFFEHNAFSAIAEYISSKSPLTPDSFARSRRMKPYFDARGVRIDSFDSTRAEAELNAIFQLSEVSFAHNFLYSPIEREEFLARYRPLLPCFESDDFLLAHGPDHRLLGFLFGMNDLCSPDARRFVIKTLAIHPGAPKGLGAFLVETAQERAFRKGMKTVIHALMHVDNISTRIGKHFQICRRYRLYEKDLLS